MLERSLGECWYLRRETQKALSPYLKNGVKQQETKKKKKRYLASCRADRVNIAKGKHWATFQSHLTDGEVALDTPWSYFCSVCTEQTEGALVELGAPTAPTTTEL